MLFVVEVYANWCGPSAAAISTYKKIKDANEAKKFKLCKVCADVAGGEGEYLEKYKINARPTFLFFRDGEQVAQVEGVSMPTLEKYAARARTSAHASQMPDAPQRSPLRGRRAGWRVFASLPATSLGAALLSRSACCGCSVCRLLAEHMPEGLMEEEPEADADEGDD